MKNFDRKKALSGERLDRFIIGLVGIVSCIPFLSLTLWVMDRDLPIYPDTILPQTWRDHYIIIVGTGLGLLYYSGCAVTIVVLLAVVGAAYLCNK
jgi:hypothetical protein